MLFDNFPAHPIRVGDQEPEKGQQGWSEHPPLAWNWAWTPYGRNGKKLI